MNTLLVLGGTHFLGAALVEQALGHGWDVTTFNRGNAPNHPDAKFIKGDRQTAEGLARLAKGSWDAVVDVQGTLPADVRASAQVLVDRAERCVGVSSIAAIEDWPTRSVNDQSPPYRSWPEDITGEYKWDPKTYGQLKAGCER